MHTKSWTQSSKCARTTIVQLTLSKRIQSGQSETNFPLGFKTKNTRNFFNLKKTWRSRVVPDGIPPESKLKPYEGDRDIPYKLFSGPHM